MILSRIASLMSIALVSASVVMAGNVAAKNYANCTTQPQSAWLDQKTAESKITEQGYTIKKFEAKKTCYKVTGTNNKNEMGYYYFDPVSLNLVQFDNEAWTKTKKKS